jgi:hypothetical protein
MEIDRDKLREFLMWLWELTEKAQAELLAHEVTFVMLKGSGHFPQLDEWLKLARENPPPELAQRHKEAREAIEQFLAEPNAAGALKTFLQNWKPKGPIQ